MNEPYYGIYPGITYGYYLPWENTLSSDTTSIIYNNDGTVLAPLEDNTLYSWTISGIDDEGREGPVYPISLAIGIPEKNDPPIINIDAAEVCTRS